MTKYRAVRQTIDGHTFDSRGEARRYCELKLLERSGFISGLKLQPKFTLQDKFVAEDGTRHRAITYTADFEYVENGRRVVEDFKGVETEAFKLKMKMFLKMYPNVVFRVTR